MQADAGAQSNIEVVRRALDAINRGDLAALATTVTPDFARRDLAQAFVFERAGADSLASFIAMVRGALPDFTMHIVDIFATEDQAAVELRLTGTHLGEILGAPGTGRHIEINGVSLYRFRDGLICENTQLLDLAGLMGQLTGAAGDREAATA